MATQAAKVSGNKQDNRNLSRYVPDSIDLRKLLFFGTLFFVLAGIVNAAAFYSLVSVTVADGGYAADTVTAYHYNEADEVGGPVKKIGDRLLIKRSTTALLFKADDSETVYSPSERGFGFGLDSITLSVSKPLTGAKVSAGSKECPLVTASGVYSYDCSQPNAIMKHSLDDGGLPKAAKAVDVPVSDLAYEPGRYKDGLLILEKVEGFNLNIRYYVSYISPDSSKKSIELPADFYDDTQYAKVITDQLHTSNTGFVIYNYSSGGSYYYKDFEASLKPQGIKRTHNLNTANEASSCTLSGTVFTCYHGFSGNISHETEDPEEQSTIRRSSRSGAIEVTDVGSAKPATKTYRGPNKFGINELFVTADGNLYGKQGLTIERLELEDDTFKHSAIANYAEIIAAGNNLTYVHDNKLYERNENNGTTSLLYKNDSEELSGITAYDNRLFVSSYSKNDPIQLLNVFQLRPEK
jgi:hypothetical protein